MASKGSFAALWVWRLAVAAFATVGVIVVFISTFIFNYETANPFNACPTGYWTSALGYSALNFLMIVLYVGTVAWTLINPKPLVNFVLRYITPIISLVFSDTVNLTTSKPQEPIELRSLTTADQQSSDTTDEFPSPPSVEQWEARVQKVSWYTHVVVSALLVALCVLVFVINLIIIGGSLGFAVFRSQFMLAESDTITLTGLSAPVTISRDTNGVVHVRAANRHDAYFAQGVVHAQDRLFQMEFNRRLGSGRLSELVGEDALDYDKLMVTLGIYDSCSSIYAALQPESQQALDAYVEGVNAYIATKPRLPLEFMLLGIEMDDWTLSDTLVYTKLMSLDLSGNMNDELLRYDLLVEQGVSPDRIEQLLREFPANVNPTILSEQDLIDSGLPNKTMEEEEAEIESRQGELDRLRTVHKSAQRAVKKTLSRKASQMQDPFKYGFLSEQRRPPSQSNNWVIGGAYTKTGMPILADDPHLRFSAPMVWYLMHLETTDDVQYDLNVTGTSIPTIPGIVIGRNNKISWGVTNSGIDVQDIYVLEESADRTQYFHNGVWVPYTFKNTTIKVKGGKDVTLHIRQTLHYGPVISDGLDDTPGNKSLALRWTSLDANDTLYDSYMRINRASDWTEFRDAMTYYTAPIQNFVFADLNGNIGYIAAGKAPIRAVNHTGKYPAPGNGDFDWTGFIPINEMPFVLNPQAGYIVTANGQIAPSSYKYNLGHDVADGYRQRRIVEMIQSFAAGTITIDDVKRMQHDQVCALWQDVRVVFQRMNDTGASKRINAKASEWMLKLLKWDGNMHRSAFSQEATVFETWYQLMTELPRKETDVDNWDEATFILTLLNATGYDTQDVYGAGEDPLFDSVCNVTDIVSCQLIAEKLLENAVDHWGRNIPVWGRDLHSSYFGNTVIGSVSGFGCLGNREVSMGGNSRTVNPAAVHGLEEDEDLIATSGASYRHIIDMSDMEKSQFVIPMGPTGNVLDKKRYESWLDKWANGEYLPMQLVPKAIASIMTLKP